MPSGAAQFDGMVFINQKILLGLDEETKRGVMNATRMQEGQTKKKLFVGAITLLISSPFIVWVLIMIFSGKNYSPDTLGAVLLFFQFLGIVGGGLLLTGKNSGDYMAICVWGLLFIYGVLRIFYFNDRLPAISNESYDFYSRLLIILGVLFLHILVKDLKKGKGCGAVHE